MKKNLSFSFYTHELTIKVDAGGFGDRTWTVGGAYLFRILLPNKSGNRQATSDAGSGST